MPILGIMASQISGKLWAPAGAYDALATITVGATAVSSITFTGIPTGYKHLQIRSTVLESNDGVMGFRFNSDSGNNYTIHELIGNGSAASAYAATSQSNIGINYNYSASPVSNAPSVAVVDVLDYSNISKYKTLRALCGVDYNGSGYVRLDSGLWLNTAAITSIDIVAFSSKTFSQYSQFSLFGVK